MTAPSTAPPLELGSSSVTVLRSSADFVVAAGLCGWLRAWQLRAEPPNEEVCTAPGCLLLHNPHTDTLLSVSLFLHRDIIYHLFRRGCSFLTSGARTTCRMDARALTRSGLSRLNPTPALALAPALAPTVTLTLRLARCVAVADGELAASTTHADGHIQACAQPGPKPVPDPKPGPKLPLPLPYP